MFYIGCHLSATNGYLAMGKEALSIGANTFQFFTRNPRGGSVKALDLDDMAAYNRLANEHGFGTIVAHAPYTLNLCSDKLRVREFGREVMRDDLERLQNIDRVVYNFHPGSHVGQGEDAGIEMIIEALNDILTEDIKTPVLLETMAGKGSEIGYKFEQLRRIIDGVHLKSKLGVCMDSCHISDAGYDVIGDFDAVLDEFDRIVGLERLYAFHLNDSKNDPASRKDRHEKIGEGTLGLDTIVSIINNPRIAHLPFALETPNDLNGYAKEIELLRARRTV
ncbi:MAG: deoxyribonuclease IV [Clostridiaceae bacterium]|jgi:deoxyribonuclease-4|nr:deoxyribonuclease IV [Clostridiaceae bacterium]